jgi:hypothetical protein
MQVLTIQHPQVLLHEALLPWLTGVCAGFKLRASAPAYIAGLCGEVHTQVLLGIEAEAPRALLVTQLPSPMDLLPTILLAYNEGSAELGTQVLAQATAWMQAREHTKFQLVNGSGFADVVYERRLRRTGLGKVVDRKSILTIELEGEKE